MRKDGPKLKASGKNKRVAEENLQKSMPELELDLTWLKIRQDWSIYPILGSLATKLNLSQTNSSNSKIQSTLRVSMPLSIIIMPISSLLPLENMRD